MSGREKVGLQSKSSNVRKDEKFLEEKKERDVSKTRSQVKTVKTLSKKIVTDKSINTSTESKGSPRNKTKAVLKSRRKNTSTPDKTTVIRRTRQSDEFLELNTELIKQSPTIIDKLISKNKSAIQKNKLKLNKQSKTMPEKSVKQLDQNDSKKNKNQSNIAKYNVNRKKIDAGKLLATTIARKKLKASQACIEKNAKKRLLRSNDLITNGDKKSLIESKVKPKLNSDIKKKANIIKKIKKSDQINNVNRVKDENGKFKTTSSDNTAGPSNYRKENADQVKSKSNADILENISPLVRPLKKFPSAANVTLTRWKLGLHNRGRGRGRGRGVRGRGHGIIQRKFSYLTRSDSPVPLLRNGKRRLCDSSDESIDHLRKRKRNLSCEFSKSDSIADDQSSYATDSEYSFCDSVSTMTTIKGEKDVDLDDSKIKVPLSSPTNYMSSSKMDSNSNLFNSNDIPSPSEKILNSTKLSMHSPSEFTSLLESKNCKSDSSPMIINGADNVKSDCSVNNESVKTKLYKCSSENVTNDLTGKIKPTMKRLSTDSKSDSIVEDMSDCDISSKNNNSNSDKKKNKLIRKKVKDNSLWVRRSLRGVQKNEELKSIVSEILKLASDDEVLEKPKSPKENIPDEKSSEYDSADDYCLIIEDSPKKTDEQSKITNTGSSILCTNRRKSLNDSEIPNQSIKIGSDNCNKIKRTKSLSESNNERIQKTLTMQTGRLNRPFKNIPLLADKTKPVNLNTMLNESNRRTINSDKSPIPVPLVNKVVHDYLENETIVLDTSIEDDDDEDDDDTDNNNADVSKNNKKICDPDVTIIETNTELIVVEDDDEDCENNNENNKNIEDENCKNKSSEDDNELDITKELIEQNKIAKIIESLEVDELNDNSTVTIIPETEQNSIIILPTKDTPNKNNTLPADTTVCNDSEETEINTITKNIVNQDNVETEAEADEEGLTESEAETEIEENIDTDETVKSRNNIEITNKIINIINCQDVLDNSDSSKSNHESGRLIRKSNDSLNINFSDQSCSSSSYISAVTEFPTSMDSDVLEINDNLSSNDCTNSATCNETIEENSSNENNTKSATTNGVNIEMKKEENKENENEIHLKITDVVSLNDDVMLQKVVEKDDEQSNDTTELHQKNEIEMIKESPEERANKESILTALGLKSLHNQCETKLYKSSDNTYTGTLKAVIKLNRNGDKSGARKMFFKQIDTNEKDSRAGGDVLEYRICSEADQPIDIEQSSDDNSSSRKLVIKQRTSSLDETSNSSVSAFASTSLDSIAGGDGKDDKGAPGKESSLVIPEKSSSFSIHPGRLCSDICSYCFGKFGSLDTPCHLAQLKNAERQQKILAVESHLKMDSCLCDGCYRFVDRKANSPQIQRVHKQKRRNHPPQVCAVQGCTHLAQHSIRKKWLVKLRKSISKQLDIEMEKHPIVPLCNQHYSLVDYFTFCGLCKKRLTRNHMYALGSEANELNYELKKDSIPVKLTDKLFLCKLCRHYSSLRLKYKDTSVLNSGNKIFLRSYRKKILACHDIVVSESEDESSGKSVEDEKEKSTQDEQSMKTKKRRSKSAGSETKKRRTDGTENNDDEPQMIDYSCLDSLQKKMDLGSTYTKKASDLVIGPGTNNANSVGINTASSVNQSESAQDSTQESQSGDGQVHLNLKISNSKVQKLNNPQASKTSAKEKSKGSVNLPPRLPGEKELALSGELKREDNGSLGRNGWEKYSLNLQFDKETKRLWNELQRPYGNQSSFLRHLVMLEKYWRSGSLVLAENADPLAVKYNNRAKTRVQAYDGPPVRPKTVEIPPATMTSKPCASTPTITVASPLSVTTPSIASSSCLTSSINSVPELVKVITKSPLLNSTAPFTTCATTTSVPITPPPTQLQTNGTLAPPPLLKLDGANSLLWHKVHSNQNPLPVYIQPNRNKQIKVVVTSVSNSSGVPTNKSTSNVISVVSGTNTTSSLRAPRPIAMTFQQFQSFQKRMKDIRIASPSLIPVINSNNSSSISNNSVSISSNNSSQMLTNSLTTITSSAAVAAAKAVTIVTTATATTTAPIPSAESLVTPTSTADTFNPMICNVLSLAGSPMTWGTSSKKTTNTGATNKVTYFTPILPKLPKTLTVRHIVPVNSSNKVSLNSSVTIEKTSGIDSPSTSTLVPEKPSISVFREECSDNNV